MNTLLQKHFMGVPVYDTNRAGYIALLTVLIAGAISASITVSLLLLDSSYSKTVIASEQSNRAKALANACAEEALEQIRSLTSFTGTGSLAIGASTCTYAVTSQGGETRTIETTGAMDTVIRKVRISVIDITPLIVLASWQEIADF